ncbi:hypothetical protein HELRODRAFT_121368, partial [Helobdella robusta]|uniref:G-protein coupled receptors family 1 profile domain-containing protein n=1 Tax=Helobdella robusta TaxID=6412 RepID=T1EGR6_HELRO
LALFSLVTIVGNILVILAVCRERYLRTATNYFIVSLSLADLLIGALVMPFSISLEAESGVWRYGKTWCDLWHSFDVLASTASILNLSIISLDRYWAITDPIAYPRKMSSNRALFLVAVVWLCSACISFPAIFWWDQVNPHLSVETVCTFTEDSMYLVSSSLISFYLPMFIIFYAYYSIYNAAVKQKKILMSGTMTMANKRGSLGLELIIHPFKQQPLQPSTTTTKTQPPPSSSSSLLLTSSLLRTQQNVRPSRLISKKWATFTLRQRISRAAKEQKAAKTLGFVVGVFGFCCFPFFVTNLLYGVCHKNCVPNADIVFPIFTWLMYVNSGMNPFIYAYSLRDFRRAFLKIL